MYNQGPTELGEYKYTVVSSSSINSIPTTLSQACIASSSGTIAPPAHLPPYHSSLQEATLAASAPIQYQTVESQWDYRPPAKASRLDDEGRCVTSVYEVPAVGSTGDIQQSCRSVQEEFDKRRMRRERNKVAAAKCRQRRVDLTNRLQVETENLEDEKAKYLEEIKDLQREKEQLEFVMQAHRPMCRMEKVPQADRPMNLKVLKSTSSSSNLRRSPSRPNCLPLECTVKQESDLNTPVFSDHASLAIPPKKSPIRALRFLEELHTEEPQSSTCIKSEPLDLHTPVMSSSSSSSYTSTPLKSVHEQMLTPSAPLALDFSTSGPGTSNGTCDRTRSASSTSSETKSPGHTFVSL